MKLPAYIGIIRFKTCYEVGNDWWFLLYLWNIHILIKLTVTPCNFGTHLLMCVKVVSLLLNANK